MLGQSSGKPRWGCLRALGLGLSWLTLLTGCWEEDTSDPGPSLSRPESLPESEAPAPEPTQTPTPNIATYTIRRGGTLLNVANLYKLHHHEIQQLNRDTSAELELPPDARVIVYRFDGEESESIGKPHDGALVGAMPMLDGPGRRITAERWKTWGTRDTILTLDRVFREWKRSHPDAPEILVGNLSSRHGGPLSPHKTHQSGRDVDISYVQVWNRRDRVTWQRMGRGNLDEKLTWDLLQLLVQEGDVEVMYMDRSIQELLYRYAQRHHSARQRKLRTWLEFASDTPQDALIRHVPGHRDHLHVRFACPADQARCKS